MASVELNEENRRKLATFQYGEEENGSRARGGFYAFVIMRGNAKGMSQGEGSCLAASICGSA